MAIAVGAEAPDFTLTSHDGEEVTLSSFRGERNVVLAFFPAAFSSVCSVQLGRIGDAEERFADEDAQVLAVSVDQRESLAAFAEQLGLDSTRLLSDFHPKGEVAQAYDVYLDQYGKASRTTFVIDKAGIVRAVEVTEHPGFDIDEDQYFPTLASCNL
jgi:peroxiredoxin (alkyl hydroperoxide reductase subunit C)